MPLVVLAAPGAVRAAALPRGGSQIYGCHRACPAGCGPSIAPNHRISAKKWITSPELLGISAPEFSGSLENPGCPEVVKVSDACPQNSFRFLSGAACQARSGNSAAFPQKPHSAGQHPNRQKSSMPPVPSRASKNNGLFCLIAIFSYFCCAFSARGKGRSDGGIGRHAGLKIL